MPLRRNNQRSFTRKLFAGQLEKIRFHKRKDDLKQGTVTAYILYGVRRSMVTKTGEPIQGDMVAEHTCVWHIPRRELDRVGIHYINSADYIQQLQDPEKDWWWQPESDTNIEVKLFGLELDLFCKRVDPLTSTTLHG